MASIRSVVSRSRGWRAAVPARMVGRVFAAALVLGAVTFLWVIGDGFHPGSPVGMAFGVAATALLAVVMLYSVRRALPSVRSLGRTQPYMDAHVYGGLAFLLLVLMHTGFGLPSGVLSTTLWAVALWVTASGLLGLALQRWIPRFLEAETTLEVHHQRIPELLDEVRDRAREAAAAAGPRAMSFYEQELAGEMEDARSDLGVLLSRGRSLRRRAGEFARLEHTVTPEAVPAVVELRRMHRTKLDLDLHNTLQGKLRLWLSLHLPLGVVLIVLVGLHIFFILYF